MEIGMASEWNTQRFVCIGMHVLCTCACVSVCSVHIFSLWPKHIHYIHITHIGSTCFFSRLLLLFFVRCTMNVVVVVLLLLLLPLRLFCSMGLLMHLHLFASLLYVSWLHRHSAQCVCCLWLLFILATCLCVKVNMHCRYIDKCTHTHTMRKKALTSSHVLCISLGKWHVIFCFHRMCESKSWPNRKLDFLFLLGLFRWTRMQVNGLWAHITLTNMHCISFFRAQYLFSIHFCFVLFSPSFHLFISKMYSHFTHLSAHPLEFVRETISFIHTN